MRCSASRMFATNKINSCTYVIRKYIYSLMTSMDTSLNPIVKSIVGEAAMCILCRPSLTSASHFCMLCSFDLAHQHHAFVLLLYGHIVHVCISIV